MYTKRIETLGVLNADTNAGSMLRNGDGANGSGRGLDAGASGLNGNPAEGAVARESQSGSGQAGRGESTKPRVDYSL